MRTFFIHYEQGTGKIHSLGPVADNDDFPDAKLMEVNEEKAMELFSLPAHMLSEWSVDDSSGTPVLTQNMLDIEPDDAGKLFEIPRKGKVVAQGIEITVSIPDEYVQVAIPDKYKGKPLKNIKEKEMSFILTKRNDPTYIVSEFVVSIPELLKEGKVIVNVNTDFNDYSLFTKRVFLNYQFEVSTTGRGIAYRTDTTRFNKLVAFTNDAKVKKGIVAKHNTEDGTIEFELVGKSRLSWPNTNSCPIFLTKPKDPTIVYDKLILNVESFWENKKISLQLPEDIPSDFGLAGYPLADTMAFVRVNNDSSS